MKSRLHYALRALELRCRKGGCPVTNFKPDDDLAEWGAAYVLGALSLTDRRAYESYLSANPTRAVELTELPGCPAFSTR